MALHFTFDQLSSKTLKTLKEFSALHNINLKKLSLKKDIVNKIHEWCTKDIFQKLINSSSITETIKDITNDFTNMNNLEVGMNVLFEHEDLDLVLDTLLNQNFKIDYGKIEDKNVHNTIKLFLNLSTYSNIVQKKILICFLYKFQLENMTLVVDNKKYREVMLNKIQEFKLEKNFQSVKWDEMINKFVDNHRNTVINVLNKNNVCTDVQNYVILKFLF